MSELPDRFDDLPRDERLRVLRAGTALTHFVFQRVGGVLLAGPVSSPGYLKNGSGFVLRLNGIDYLGTAWHVVAEWLSAVTIGQRVIFQVGRLAIKPDQRLAWKDEVDDIAFFRLEPGESERTGIVPCEPLLGWPLPHPAIGQYVLISGFPGTERLRPALDEIDFGAFSALMQLTVSQARYVVCQFQREHWVSEHREPPPPGSDLGGMSGGPVLLVTNLAYPLVGLISEFSRDFELLYIKTLSHVPATLA